LVAESITLRTTTKLRRGGSRRIQCLVDLLGRRGKERKRCQQTNTECRRPHRKTGVSGAETERVGSVAYAVPRCAILATETTMGNAGHAANRSSRGHRPRHFHDDDNWNDYMRLMGGGSAPQAGARASSTAANCKEDRHESRESNGAA